MQNSKTILPPITERSGPLRWLRHNLFNTWGDALLTVASASLIYWLVKSLLIWAISTAE